MINHLRRKIFFSSYLLPYKFLKQKCLNRKRRLFLCSSSQKDHCNLKGRSALDYSSECVFYMNNKKKDMYNITTYSGNYKNCRELFKGRERESEKANERERANDSEREKKKVKEYMYYPESNSFPYATVCIILGMIGISSFFKILIYNLKDCENEESIIFQVDKILAYLDNYFIIHNFEEKEGKEEEYDKKINNKNDLINIKYITSQFFTNENILQCAVQLSTFFLASRFLEKKLGSLKYFSLFLCGSFLSNIITFYFFKYIKKVQLLNFVDFVLIHPSGSMAFICALCSLCFKNCSVWKNIPIHCSILIVPYLFSSFYGLLLLYKIKGNSTDDTKYGTGGIKNDLSGYAKDGLLEHSEFALESKSPQSSRRINNSRTNEMTDEKYDNEKKQGNDFIYGRHNYNNEYLYNKYNVHNNQNEALNTLKNFLTIKACDSVMKKRKKENMFLNKKIQNLKKKALENLNEISNKSHKLFFGLSSSFTDIFGIILATAVFFLKFLK
ncbi:hypothetical protein MKS88_000963 [Plasmodium brasilianum]|uniref:Uncharacterized protein n=2 Tax=Plasmodium (Plasmodium) TaxID=418103 RepID=A0A1D3JIH9_PLAMA|nr:conserved Plasmodium protein, unknown function [Plasmodium malariae]KAI4840728.1 hypothetical protein MKS88_000963 [Plasmodium brasilianum]SBT86295.1 conserved Plasmodium protein, unknown function [Plasmodium malariae]